MRPAISYKEFKYDVEAVILSAVKMLPCFDRVLNTTNTGQLYIKGAAHVFVVYSFFPYFLRKSTKNSLTSALFSTAALFGLYLPIVFNSTSKTSP